MKTGDFQVGESLPTPDEPDCAGERDALECEAEGDEDMGLFALELLASSPHPPDAAFCPSSLDELKEWKERMKAALLQDLARIKGGAQELGVCVVTLDAAPSRFDPGEFARAWACGELPSAPSGVRRHYVLSERICYHGRDAYPVHLREVFGPAALRDGLPWAGKVVYIANKCDPDGHPLPQYFAAVDLVPELTHVEGTLYVVLKSPDGATAYVALNARQSIGELKGDPLPRSWEGVSIGMFVAPPATRAERRKGRSRRLGRQRSRPSRLCSGRA